MNMSRSSRGSIVSEGVAFIGEVAVITLKTSVNATVPLP